MSRFFSAMHWSASRILSPSSFRFPQCLSDNPALPQLEAYQDSIRAAISFPVPPVLLFRPAVLPAPSLSICLFWFPPLEYKAALHALLIFPQPDSTNLSEIFLKISVFVLLIQHVIILRNLPARSLQSA